MAGVKTAVYKYPFDIEPSFQIEMLAPAEILHVDVQYGRPCMWVMVWPEAESSILREFVVYGTGQTWQQTDNIVHHGTVLLPGASVTYVWHVFEIQPWRAIKRLLTKSRKPEPEPEEVA